MLKKCSKCKIEKPFAHFHKDAGTKSGRTSLCTECSAASWQLRKHKFKDRRAKWRKENKAKIAWHNRKPETRYKKAIRMAISRRLNFSLTLEEYCAEILKPCFYCNGAFGTSEAGVGLDRLDNSKGYEPNNVKSCCTHCNRVRGNNLTVEEMRAVIILLKTMRKLD